VVSQQIVTRDDSADRWVAEATMAAMPIVVVQPTRQCAGALGRRVKRHAIGPLAQHGLDEALGFAVGAGRVGPRPPVQHALCATGGREDPRAVARAIVREHATDVNAAPTKPLHRAADKARDGNAGFIGEDFGVGDARAVIDADVDVLPPDAARLAPAIAGDPMPDVLDPAQLFDVQMQHLPRPRPFVADKDGALRQRLEAREVQLRQRARDRGRAHLNDLRDLGPRPPELPQPLDFHHHRRGNRTGRAPGPAGAIMEFIPRRANDPLPRRPIAHAKGAGHRGHAFAGLDSLRDARSTVRRCPGILVHVHPGCLPRVDGRLATTTFAETSRMDNLLRDHS